ncbi:Ribosome maturation protein sdo1 [Neolecta irregularis DAH-3]|uniref:Ribosome maturation protein sdo1 n=1 Tax=Neolecta irregularis (strain DAH-3) TaxID=1198029 RepID=A0A1U7LVC2_NEOID|nr:Ribosome maturation protein sdo1 [Neolecta irregularis DAH-3]|eukprot:OLL26568.1 Ribosome maturation protein sdo1 [Neolecta irregularis DAH-3]
MHIPSELVILNDRLTNVSIVRLRKGGKRFEAACYRNKVLEWRSGVESDIDEVLQIHSVFINVGKGQVASQEDLRKCFGSDDIEKILLEILKKGELQVGEKERSHQMENLQKDIILTISSKCVDPRTKRPYTVGIIEKAIGEIGFSINIGKSAKSQA